MNCLLLNQFYPPDPAPTGWYLHGLALTLVQRGHRVRVLCSRRSYDGKAAYPAREVIDGVEVLRLAATGFGRRGFAGKLADYASFYGTLLLALMRQSPRPDLILSLTTPPYIGLLGKAAARRYRCGHAHWIMDLYPDVMFAHGMTSNRGLKCQLLTKLTRAQFQGAGFVLTLGPMMAEKVGAYMPSTNSGGANESALFLGDPKNTEVLSSKTSALPASPRVWWSPLWSDPLLAPWPEEQPNPLRKLRGWATAEELTPESAATARPSETVFLYSGNMGLGHRFQEFLQTATRLGPAGPRWVFSGGGKRRAEIEAYAKAHPATRIELLGYVPQKQLQAHLCSADVHLASLDASWQGCMVPSKLQGIFAVGRPVLFVGARQNETAAWILESGGGWVVAENDIDGLVAAVREAMDPAQRRKRGLAALAFARSHFQMNHSCVQIAGLMEWAAGRTINRGVE